MSVWENGRLWYQMYTDTEANKEEVSRRMDFVPVKVEETEYRIKVNKTSYSSGNHIQRLRGGGSVCQMQIVFSCKRVFRFDIGLRLTDSGGVVLFDVSPNELLIGDGYTKEDIEHILTMWQLTRDAR